MVFRCLKISQWRPKNPAAILQKHGRIYSSPDPDTRVEVEDLCTYPLEDENGKAIPIYTDDGIRIGRQIPMAYSTDKPCGLLLKLQDLHDLFVSQDDELGNETEPIRYEVYPQAFLRSHGHFQANGLMSGFRPIIDNINLKLRSGLDAEDEAHYPDALKGIACQGYNEAMHRIRPLAKFHDVQLGHITAAAAGTHASLDKDKLAGERCYRKCIPDLPHQRFAKKIDTPGLKRELRVENVYTLNVLAMAPNFRNGK